MLLSLEHWWRGDPGGLRGQCPPGTGIAKSSFGILLGRRASVSQGLCDSNHSGKAAPRGESEKKTNAASSNFCY